MFVISYVPFLAGVSNPSVAVLLEIIAEEVDGMKKNMQQQIEQRGLTLEQYYQITGQKPEDVEKNMRVEADKNVRTILCMEAIANAEKLNVNDADVEKEMASIAETYKMPVDKVKEILGADMNRFKAELRQRKIQDFLVKENIA